MTIEATPRIAGVLETCLYAEDLEGAARFYSEVLGLAEHSREPGRHVFFRVGRGMLLLFDPRKTSIPGGDVPPHGARGPGHVAFATHRSQLPDWRSHLGQHGVDVEAEVTWPNGGTSLYLRDPAGNSVEITTPGIWSIPDEVAPPADER